MKKIANFISTIGNPIFIGLFFGIYINFFHKDAENYGNLPIIFSLTILIPATVFIFYNVKTGRFHDKDVSDKKKRNQLYLFIMLCFGVLGIILFLFDFPIKAELLVLAFFVQLLISYFINQKYKISLHSSFAFLFAILFYPLNHQIALFLYIFGFLIIWSRLELHRHKPIEVILGFTLGNVVGLGYLLAFNHFIYDIF